MGPVKDNTQKILIAILALFVAQVTLTASLGVKQIEMEKHIQTINNDYTPLFVMEAVVESNQLMVEEIIAVKEGDKEAVQEIQQKNFDFQRRVLSALARKRGGEVTSPSLKNKGEVSSIVNVK